MAVEKAGVAVEAAKSAPPVAVMAAAIAGLTLQEWVFVVTIVYVVLQAGYLAWKWRREARKK